MLIAVLSDLHLGRRDHLDRFGREPHAFERFMRLLTYLEKHVDRIVLLGDVFETLRGKLPGSRRTELIDSLKAYPEIASRIIDDPRYTFLHGNHDHIAGDVLNVPDTYVLEADKKRLVFFHGHQLDFLTRRGAAVSELFVCMGGWLERMGVKVTRFVDRVRPGVITSMPKVGRFERAAVAFGAEMSADIVITGHTHEAKRVEIGDQLFMNSGTCVSGRRELLILDTTSDVYRVVREPDFL